MNNPLVIPLMLGEGVNVYGFNYKQWITLATVMLN